MGIRIFLLSTILVTTFLVTLIEASSKGGHCRCRLSWPEKSVKYHENNCNYGYKPSGHLKEVSAYDDLTYIQCTCGCKITDWHKKQKRRKTRITRSKNLDSEYLIRVNWKKSLKITEKVWNKNHYNSKFSQFWNQNKNKNSSADWSVWNLRGKTIKTTNFDVQKLTFSSQFQLID